MYLNGAHVTSWVTADGIERLFLSRNAILEPGKAIRGGIPVVFPQFADSGPLPRHGWLRTTEWQVDSASQSTSSVTLFTGDTAETREIWPHRYRAELSVELEADSIDVALRIINTGSESFTFTSALHTYLAVTDVRRSELNGLTGAQYIDKTDNDRVKTEDSRSIQISGETDRIYRDATGVPTLSDGNSKRSLSIESTGFPDVVVWNPWKEKTRSLPDMADDEYLKMICVEAALVDQPMTLAPGESWRGGQIIAAP